MSFLVRFVADVVVTLLLSALVFAVSEALMWNWPYWIALLISAVIVFFGEILLVSSSGGGWDFDF